MNLVRIVERENRVIQMMIAANILILVGMYLAAVSYFGLTIDTHNTMGLAFICVELGAVALAVAWFKSVTLYKKSWWDN